MSIFETLQNNIELIQRLSANSSAHPEDVEKVKKRLGRDGYYDTPPYGITPYPDQPLFDGIRKFQRDNGLEIDGVMNPDGETLRAMNRPILLASNFEMPEIVKEKKDFFKTGHLGEHREVFSKNLNAIDVKEREYKSIMTTYDFEGGDAADGKTVSGLTVPTLRDLNKRYDMKLPSRGAAGDLTSKDRAKLLINYGDYSFERIGGRGAYDKFPDEHAAKTLFDTTIRHGASGGSALVRKALNVVRSEDEPALSEGEGRIGEQTLDRLISVSKDPQRRKEFYDALADERTKEYPDEYRRFDYFRVEK